MISHPQLKKRLEEVSKNDSERLPSQLHRTQRKSAIPLQAFPSPEEAMEERSLETGKDGEGKGRQDGGYQIYPEQNERGRVAVFFPVVLL